MGANARNGSVPVGDTVMRYAAFGNGEKALILLPGLSDGLATVKGKAGILAGPYRMFFEKYTVYMFSRKDEMPEGYSIKDMADDQAEAMEKLGIREAYVCGVSQGGMIAQALAVYHPEKVKKLVIAVSAPAANDLIRDNIGTWLECTSRGDHKQLMIDTAEKSYSEAYLKSFRLAYPVIGMIGKPKTYRRFEINAHAILGFDLEKEIGTIRCPVLIIAGEADRIVGAEASYRMHEQIPGSRLYVYPGLGHGAYEEAKDFNARLLEFFEA